MHNPESVLETRIFLRDFEIKTDCLISARRKKKKKKNEKKKKRKNENLPNIGLCVPADHRIKLKESEQRDKY